MKMAADMNKMTKFFLPLFRETENPGSLTKRILRQKYLDHAGLDKLSDAQEGALRDAISKALDMFEMENEASDDGEEFKNKSETNKKRKLPKSASKSDSRKPSAKKSKKKDSSGDDDDDDFKPSKGKNKTSKTAVKKAVAVKNISKKKTSVVKAAESSSEDEVLVKKQPEKKSVPIKSAKSHSEDTSDDEALVKPKGDVKKDDKPAEKESDQDELQSSDEEPNKTEVKKEPPSKEMKSDSDSEEELKSAGDTNGKQIQHKVEKKPTIKKPKTKKTESSDEKEDSDIEKMKGYVRAAGIRITKYSKLFEDCLDKTSKLNKLKSVLEEAGLKGRPSLKACQKIKKTRETAKEVAELDVENILEGSSGRTRRKKSEAKKAKKEETKTKVPDENGKNVFARLQDIVDSD